MPHERTTPTPDYTISRCVHFRSKAMYVTGQLDPESIDEQHNHGENCWCNLTQHVVGPDQQLVTLDECTYGRGCFRNV